MSNSPENLRRTSECEDGEEIDLHFEPIVSLPIVEVNTNEENEEVMLQQRARLYRYDMEVREWKERGTGDIKILRHKDNNSIRVVMRRDKTLKICANHFVTPDIRMNIHCNSNRSFNWSVFADFADERPKQEVLAIKFRTPELADNWIKTFHEAQEILRTKCPLYNNELVDSSSEDESSSLSQSDDRPAAEVAVSEEDAADDSTVERASVDAVKPANGDASDNSPVISGKGDSVDDCPVKHDADDTKGVVLELEKLKVEEPDVE